MCDAMVSAIAGVHILAIEEYAPLAEENAPHAIINYPKSGE